MPDQTPNAPEDRPATLGDIAAAEQRIVDRLTEVMRDMQTEILTGLQAFARWQLRPLARPRKHSGRH